MIGIGAAVANPFPGLRAFEPEEDYLFFGRERQVDELLRNLRRTRFLSVVGSSGSGKSSLVRAGLIPALYGGGMVGAGSHWRIAMFRPGEDPLGRLAKSLRKCGLLDNTEFRDSDAMLEATLRRSSLGLAEAYELAGLNRRENLLVMVDQFEELFRYRASGQTNYQDDAVAFVKLLLAAAQSEWPIYIALTMRSDFIGNCADYPDLPAAVSEGQYLVPRMNRSELREAIAGPVSVGGAKISARLVVRLLNEAGEDPEQLPVLQHALMRTWEYWKREQRNEEPIDFRHYEAIGTMANALSVHADEAYAELKSDRERQIIEKAFKALTETDEQGRGVRRPTTVNGICAVGNFEEQEVKEVLDRFREPARAFLSPPAAIPLHSYSVIDLSHESLMRVWKRLQGWVAEEQQAAELYLRLQESARRHARGEQSLWRNPELGVGLQWFETNAPNAEWANRYQAGFAEAVYYLKQSEKAEKKRRTIRAAAIAALVLVALAVVGVYALWQRTENQKLRVVNTKLNQEVDQLQSQIKILQSTKPAAQEVPPPSTSPIPAPVFPPKNQPKPAENRPPAAKVEQEAELLEFAREMVAAHNVERAKPGVPPLAWSNKLAEMAQKWADTLAATGQSKMEGIAGQNIAYAGPPGRMTAGSIVQSWAAEVQNFDYEKNACVNPSLKCYHYTQVVWRWSKYVGCGTAHDAQRDIWVCDYDPPGNEVGARPY
jgi:uncharacterized protein YkwD